MWPRPSDSDGSAEADSSFEDVWDDIPSDMLNSVVMDYCN